MQDEALKLYELGFNVFPQPYGQKAGMPWKQLQYTRLHPEHPQVGVAALFRGQWNIAVMCGRTSGNLFVLDCETDESFRQHKSQLRARNIPVWSVETARGGHLYLRCAEGEVANIESGIMHDCELRGSKGYVLTAESIHPSGLKYRWLDHEGKTPPVVSLKQIDWLTDINGKPIRLRLTRGGSKNSAYTANFSPLSRATQDYLANGSRIAPGSRNNRLFSAACDMAGNGYSEHEAEQQLIAIASSSGLPAREAYATIRSAFSRERKPARPARQQTAKQPTEVQQHGWKYALAYCEAQTWTGRTGSSDRAVLLALIEKARLVSNEKGIFRASTREISVLARVGINTVQNALKRLQEGAPPIIFYSGRDNTSQASLWKFSSIILREGKRKTESSPPVPPWISRSDSVLCETDAIERGALGHSGMRVYEGLLALGCPMLPSPLAAELRMSVHQVNYALRKMRLYGLVVREKKGWRALSATPAQLDERVARPSRRLGRGRRRVRRYAEQRMIYVGRIVWRARIDMYLAEAKRQSLLQSDSCSEGESCLIVEQDEGSAELKLWKCPNCGQVHFADVPPDMCDFCRDFTTWKLLGDARSGLLSDPLILFGIELGGVPYVRGPDGKEHPLLPGMTDESP
ncbi:MAG: bifunctional DNA primase/polymerase [Chloroflexi bacterium]|nr:bifunctional DNA primase/polymerase [Chloroflexota bacterium]